MEQPFLFFMGTGDDMPMVLRAQPLNLVPFIGIFELKTQTV